MYLAGWRGRLGQLAEWQACVRFRFLGGLRGGESGKGIHDRRVRKHSAHDPG